MPDAEWKEKPKALEQLLLSRYVANMIYLNKKSFALFGAALLVCLTVNAAEPLFDRRDITKVPSEPPQAMSQSEYSHAGVTGSYFVFTPPRTRSASGPRPLLVFLHGCTQDAQEFATLTKMNELAIRENFYVLYPQQSEARNKTKCWNWFDAQNHKNANSKEAQEAANSADAVKGSELEWIASLTSKVAGDINADTSRVYIAGISAGGAMAVNLLSCHPDLFAAGGVFAGTPFAGASNVLEALSVMKIGTLHSAKTSAEKAYACAGAKTGSPVSLLVFHGKSDLVVSHRNAKQIVAHFEAFNDLRDDGRANGSDELVLASRKATRKKKNAHAFTTETYESEAGSSVRLISVKRLGHSWSGGAKDARYTDTRAPSATDALWNFFSSLEPKESADVSNAATDSDKR